MQPEEIIQQKEWHELSAEEIKTLQPLAADEQEFNLLKKMLMVADEVSTDVPAIRPGVQEQLSRSVKSSNNRSEKKIWFYAAAAVLLVVVAAWFHLRTRVDDKPGIVNSTTEKKTESPLVINNPADSNKIKPGSTQSIPTQQANNQPAIAAEKAPKAPLLANPEVVIPNRVKENPQIAYVNTSTLIKDDTELMSLITEVYCTHSFILCTDNKLHYEKDIHSVHSAYYFIDTWDFTGSR